MKFSIRRIIAVLIAMAAVTTVAPAPSNAQIPDEFTNLTVLPKDISKRELVQIMRAFSGALGKRCIYCHVGEDPSNLGSFDFASDEKQTKKTARIMMKMTTDINGTYLAELEKDNTIRVRCITCHRGVNEPETIDKVVLAAAEEKSVNEAIVRYRELRKEYYGSGSYDFTAGPLTTVAETLADKDLPGAIEIMKVNLEFNPDDAFAHLFMARLYQASGDKAAAIASAEKSLELEPDNKWAKGLLQKLKASD